MSRAPYRQCHGSDSLRGELAKLGHKKANLAKTFLPGYPELATVRDRIAAIEKEIAKSSQSRAANALQTYRAEYLAALGEEQELRTQLDAVKASMLRERGEGAQYTILSRDVDTNRELYDALLQRYKEVGVAGSVGDNEVAVVDRAQVPASPVWPIIPLNLVAGLALGLIAGFVGSFGYDLLHERISGPRDVESRLGLKALGTVPLVDEDTVDCRDAQTIPSRRLPKPISTSPTSCALPPAMGFPRRWSLPVRCPRKANLRPLTVWREASSGRESGYCWSMPICGGQPSASKDRTRMFPACRTC